MASDLRVGTGAIDGGAPAPLTPEAHQARHVELHRALDELFADYIGHHLGARQFLDLPIGTLLRWSYEQTQHPTELPR